jgi:hypothetical protein
MLANRRCEKFNESKMSGCSVQSTRGRELTSGGMQSLSTVSCCCRLSLIAASSSCTSSSSSKLWHTASYTSKRQHRLPVASLQCGVLKLTPMEGQFLACVTSILRMPPHQELLNASSNLRQLGIVMYTSTERQRPLNKQQYSGCCCAVTSTIRLPMMEEQERCFLRGPCRDVITELTSVQYIYHRFHIVSPVLISTVYFVTLPPPTNHCYAAAPWTIPR